MKQTVYILYGLAEGPQISKRLTQLLQKNNFIVSKNIEKADVIIAHSGGVYFVPEETKAKKVLLVGATLGFTDSLLRLQAKKVKLDFIHAIQTKEQAYWFYKSLWNAYYLLTKVQYNLAMYNHSLIKKTLLPQINAPEVFVITYKNDPWSGYLNPVEKQKFPRYNYIVRAGVHDDLWINPENYLEYLLK